MTFSVFYFHVHHFEVNFWMSALFPSFGRLLWGMPVCIFLVIGTTNTEGENYANHIRSKKY